LEQAIAMKNRPLDRLAMLCFIALVAAPLAYTLWQDLRPAPSFAPVDDGKMAEWILHGPQPFPTAEGFEPPVTLTPTELHGALYAYTQFFAIAHDGWASSESTRVWSRIALSGLPEDDDAEAQLQRFPHLSDRMQRTPRWLVKLRTADDRFIGGGVLTDPTAGRLMLAHRSLVQDGYGGLALCLGDPLGCDLEVALQFTPADDTAINNLDRYTLALAGELRDGRIEIDAISSPVSDAEHLLKLVDAGTAIDEYRTQFPTQRLKLDDAEQAAAVVQLAARLMIEATQEDSEVVCGPRGYDDLASVAAFVRYGSWMLGSVESEF
jgi:hypothetical protein